MPLAEEAMRRAVEHANRVSQKWSERALSLVVEYATRHESFRTEHVRVSAELSGFEVPPSRRAWGSVMVVAARKNIIRRSGFAMSAQQGNSHPTPVAFWKSLIYHDTTER